MNPMAMMKIKGLLDRFRSNHPKVPMFFSAASQSITNADGKKLCTNMKVTADDLELFEQLKNTAG